MSREQFACVYSSTLLTDPFLHTYYSIGDDPKSSLFHRGGLLPWLENKLAEMGLEVYHQNFTAEKPVSFSSEVGIM